jgi:excinuclease ABC subunit A
LNRPARTLSGGEGQRIRLATQIGTQLVGVLYILDEPSIGLHQRDNIKLIESLKSLRDLGNTVIVVEHDKEMIESADYVVDLGPRAGEHGGRVVITGTPEQLKSEKVKGKRERGRVGSEISNHQSLTAAYLRGEHKIEIPPARRQGNGKSLTLKGATGNNLKNLSLQIQLGTLVCVTGVSGSGKSTIINETLFPILSRKFYKSKLVPLPYKSVDGIQHIDKIIDIDQSPIGRTPRSNPATYTGLFTLIRDLFTQLPEAQIRGYKAGRFSFNVKGGRCENCEGDGVRKIEMSFLPDVYVHCDVCNGKRYNRETLEVHYKGKSIADVLNMTVAEAMEQFSELPRIHRHLQTLHDVGMGYIRLGQQATTLSGGEAQRVKLSTELSKIGTGKTLYILDEPTTGLHFEDIRMLLLVLNRLVDKGNTVIVIEHNLDVIKTADWVIDLGPEGGDEGGEIVAEGTPEQIAKNQRSYTGEYLKKILV